MTMFKVGDKVRRKLEERVCGWPYGDEVKVVNWVNDSQSFIEFEGGDVGFRWYANNFELVEPATKPRPQAGEYWRQRDGTVVGPLRIYERTGCLFVGENMSTSYWHITGVWAWDREDERDLVEKADVCAHCGQPIAKSV